MGTKLEWASAVALAASVVTAVVSTQGSGAAASDHQPVPALDQNPVVEAEDASALPSSDSSDVAFVAEPVVQTLPASGGTEVSGDDTAETLAQLVAMQDAPAKLSRNMRCLAGAIYFEARGESLEGQLAVGRVVINRANSDRFPDSYCSVVLQRSQFSFVRRGRLPHIPERSAAWKRAVAVARIAAADGWDNPAKGALFFHAARISPRWGHARLARVDNHIFYR
ncbi:cell wall hydrolase [Novosphingobium decolorationis]|uniref:Cell wall hydrolase n=1 Tax=Novosphingobium decolorationis TaxID=2698673 RepID=A0ABX8E5M1_9SPHN|nr:cell wall hydrolase [Novosphingobium decolorationis]QVM84466.1 cell wall hydrolase [Novosphingobium decolorationis]